MRSFQAAMTLGAAAATSILLGCLGRGGDRVLGIESSGIVRGSVFLDANGNRQIDAADPPAAAVQVGLLPRGSFDTLARATSNAAGFFRMTNVPVGSYDVSVNPTSLADTVEVARIDTSPVTVTPNDSISVTIAISYPKLTVSAARALPVGVKVFVEGIALNRSGLFGDTTLHISDGVAAIRATRVRRDGIVSGDSVRLLAITSQRGGQPTLDDATPFLLGNVGAPTPETTASATARSAGGGRLDAALVRVAGATISSAVTVAGDLILTVDDGSGSLDVVLDKDIAFSSPGQYAPGATLTAVGLLVPAGSGSWLLKPRGDADLSVN